MNEYFLSRLNDAIGQLSLDISSDLRVKLVEFVFFLEKWNKAFNLTSVRKPEEILRRHIYDSLSVVPFVQGQRIADVGSGGGIPGIPLAMVYPDKQFVLIDSNGKKTRFITQAKLHFKLDNLSVVQSRVEEYRPEILFDQIITRGFADVALSAQLLDHLWDQSGMCLLMKGPAVFDELEQLENSNIDSEVVSLSVPDTDEQRYLLKLKRKS